MVMKSPFCFSIAAVLVPVTATAQQTPPPPPQEAVPVSTAVEAVSTGARSVRDAYRGIVKIEITNLTPDYETPWQTGRYGRGNGTGFMVQPGVFMTNAHVVANSERLYVLPYADARKYPAKVKYVAHDADLALVEVEDKKAFESIPCLEFMDRLPRLEEEVRAVGYPMGGTRLSVTRGIVSRIDTIPYSHPRNIEHLTVQIDAAINPGNSGGPVLLGDRVIGVAFQGLRNADATGYMIPIPVISRFLQDIRDGRYDKYVDFGARFFNLENPAMRAHFGLPDDATGSLVADVVKGGSCDGVLQPGDVVLAVDNHPVDSSCMIELNNERVKMEEMADRRFAGDRVTFDILRDGQKMQVTATLAPLPARDVKLWSYDERPRYVEFAGFVFQPLNLNVVQANDMNPAEFMLAVDDFMNRGGAQKKKDLVLLTKVLPDEVNTRCEDFGNRVVTKVNGTEVTGLAHLHELLNPEDKSMRPEFVTIEFDGASRPVVLEAAALDAANERIRNRYNIHQTSRL